MRMETVSVNGIDIYVERKGMGIPLLLLHGGGGAGANWELIFPSAPQGYELIIPDLRGHGRTTGSAENLTFRQIALDVMGVLDQFGILHFNAIGFSMGAKTLLHISTRFPERVEAQILVSATPYFPDSTRALMRATVMQTRTDEAWDVMRQWHRHGDDQIKAIWAMPGHLAEDYEDMNFSATDLGKITARTLIVHGDSDPLYPLELARMLDASIPQSELWIVPQAGHSPIFGEFANPFIEKSLSFLKSK